MEKIMFGLMLKESGILFGYDSNFGENWLSPCGTDIFLCENSQVANHVRHNTVNRKPKKYPYCPEHEFNPEQIEVVEVKLTWKNISNPS